FAALHHLDFDWIPDFGPRRCIERRPVLPAVGVEGALVICARRADVQRIAVLPGWSRERELRGSRRRIVGIGVGDGWSRSARRSRRGCCCRSRCGRLSALSTILCLKTKRREYEDRGYDGQKKHSSHGLLSCDLNKFSAE